MIGRDREALIAQNALRSGAGLIVAGNAGVGSSFFVEQIVATHAATANELRVIDASGADPHLRRTIESKLAAASEDGAMHDILVHVDGVQAAPSATLTWLCVQARRGTFQLVTTVRSPPPIDDQLVKLWKDGKSIRIDLEPLDHAMVTELLATRLDGLVSADLAWHVWKGAAGNARHTHALIDEGLRSGSITYEHDTWLIQDNLLPGQAVLDLVSNELLSLSDEKRTVLQIVALAEALPLSTLLRLVDPRALDELIDHGRLEVIRSESSMDATIRITQPAFAGAVRAIARPGRSRELYEKMMSSVSTLDNSANTCEHFIQRVNWAIASGIEPERETLIDAYRAAARLDRRVDTERLATAALVAMEPSDPRRFDAFLTRAAAKRLLGRIYDALADMQLAEEALNASFDDTQTAEYTSMRLRLTISIANAHHFGLADLSYARAYIDAQLATHLDSGNSEVVLGLTGLLAQHGAYGGDFDAVEQLCKSNQPGFVLPLEAQLEMHMPAVFSQALHGDLGGAIDRAKPQIELALDVAEAFPWAAQEAQSVLFMLLLWAGHIDQAEALMELADTAAPPTAHTDHAMRQTGWGMMHAAKAEWDKGRRQLDASSARFRTLDFSGWLPISLTWEALAHAATGQSAKAAITLDEARALPLRASSIIAFDLKERWCRTAVAIGHPDASDLAHEMIRDARAHNLDLAELWGWHGLALTGSEFDEVAMSRIDHLEYLDELPLPRARLDHIRALIENDPKAVAVATRGLARLGVWTPIRNRTTNILSARQREVAKLTALGLTSKEISERLYLSVRTVETHLGHIYTRLGVHTRAELAIVLSAQDNVR